GECCLWFFFSSRRRHTRLVSDWSSDVCSSDLSLVYEDTRVSAGERYGYRLGVLHRGVEEYLGETWVDVPRAAVLALVGARPNPRSEERRVGKECRGGWAPCPWTKIEVAGV